jgi:hypothetical protein
MIETEASVGPGRPGAHKSPTLPTDATMHAGASNSLTQPLASRLQQTPIEDGPRGMSRTSTESVMGLRLVSGCEVQIQTGPDLAFPQ